MNEKELRALLRKEIKSQLNEAGGTDFLGKISNTLRSKLGSGRTQLNVGLSKIDPEQISKATPEEKANLIAQLAWEVGLTARDFNIIKQRIARKLGAAEKDASTTQTESKVSTTIQKKTDKTFDTPAGESLISSLEGKTAIAQADIIINMLSKLPLDKDTMSKLKQKITPIRK